MRCGVWCGGASLQASTSLESIETLRRERRGGLLVPASPGRRAQLERQRDARAAPLRASIAQVGEDRATSRREVQRALELGPSDPVTWKRVRAAGP